VRHGLLPTAIAYGGSIQGEKFATVSEILSLSLLAIQITPLQLLRYFQSPFIDTHNSHLHIYLHTSGRVVSNLHYDSGFYPCGESGGHLIDIPPYICPMTKR
jgi:hypothetical protein